MQHPEAFAAYQRIVAVPASTVRKMAAPNPWVSEFIRMVDEHRSLHGASRTAALEAVRQAHPAVFARFQET